MAICGDLIEQAKHLATREQSGPPKQASLRHAVSGAYYALFHLLSTAAAIAHAPTEPAALRFKVQRTLDHGQMKDACNRLISRQNVGAVYASLLPAGATHSAELRIVANAFVTLQEARHTADYDLQQKPSRADVLRLIEEAEWAILAWNLIRTTAEANIFLSELMFGKKLNRG